MKNPLALIRAALQDKKVIINVDERMIQFSPRPSVTVDVTHWFHTLQIRRNGRAVATFYKVDDCIKFLSLDQTGQSN